MTAPKVTDEQVLNAVKRALRAVGEQSGRAIVTTAEISHYGKLPISQSTLTRCLYKLERLGGVRKLRGFKRTNVWEIP